MNILAVIPARGGSKGIPKKNLIKLLGKPLIVYTIEAAKSSKKISKLILTTDDKEIASIGRELNLEVIKRPPELSTDFATSHSAILHAYKYVVKNNYKPDAILTLQPTSPLRTSLHIDESINIFEKHNDADSLVSCIKLPHIFNPESIMKLSNKGYLNNYSNGSQTTRRQEKNVYYARNGAAIYLTRSKSIDKFIFGGKILPYIMNELDSIDIDNLEDLLKAELFLKYREN
mgnify:CR=1 FL=1